jgi:peptidoglycan/xylan/chitin deacetylase (PgdA/CDA1 family)
MFDLGQTHDGRTPAIRHRLRQALKEGMTRTLPRRLFVARGSAASRSVHLTFDDGPHETHTPELLDMLKAHRVPATFFVVGDCAERHPEIVQRMAREGHTIGHHSYHHTEPESTSAGQLMGEVERTQALLYPLIGHFPGLFRPPRGAVTAAKLWRLWLSGQTVVLWNVDPQDCARQSADELGAWFAAHPLRGGDIVLLHDDMPHAIRVLPEVIAEARRRGLDFQALAPRVLSRHP